ncbi:hypothetical protein PJ900_26245 [Tistrella mobilis]|uniref:hypothetical protein n=1 Tax=Tistrella mobilis TaxID=171437 RepID=UPI000A9E4932|nr:hypothetical protein [Tistrella mobilis]
MAATDPDLRIDALAPHHDRAGFSCGIDDLDRHLATQAGQDVRRKANGVFVVTASARPETVLGYYTLCATPLEPGAVPAAARKHIPRYPLVSATLLGGSPSRRPARARASAPSSSPTPCAALTPPPRQSVPAWLLLMP